MATVKARKRKKGTVYCAEIRIKGHPSLSQTFERKSEAHRWAEETETALRNNGYVGNAPPDDMLFDDAWAKYLAEVSARKAPSTHRRELAQDKPLQYFHGHTLKDITPTMVAQFRDWRLGAVQAGTVIKDLNTVSHIFTTAVREWGVEAANPVLIIKKPKAPAGRLRFLTDGEIVKLLKESRKGHRGNLYHFLLLQLHTGMRPSEGASLTWSQIDFDGRVIDLQKTKTDPRRVPLTVPALETLSKLVPAGDYKCSNFVFLPKEPKMTYRRRPNQYFRESFEAAIKRAKISDFHMHDLRHTAASYMIMNGVDLRTVADILGHKTIAMTMKYTHLLDDHKLKAIDRIAGLGL
ncbi:MAG: site-specific integrase [Proteobacteria bacterium]|nr:site-specific integrase [Pseudomonadota bacterium]